MTNKICTYLQGNLRHEVTVTHARRSTEAGKEHADEAVKAADDLKNDASSTAEDVRDIAYYQILFSLIYFVS